MEGPVHTLAFLRTVDVGHGNLTGSCVLLLYVTVLLVALCSWSGLLHEAVESWRWPAAADHPVAPPGWQGLCAQRGVLFTARGPQGPARAAHGSEPRPLLLLIQLGLPGAARGGRLEKWTVFFKKIVKEENGCGVLFIAMSRRNWVGHCSGRFTVSSVSVLQMK